MTTATSVIREGSGPLVTQLPFSDAEYQRRLDGVRKAMGEKGVDAFLSFTPENLYYLTAHDTPGYYFYQAMLVTHSHRPINVTRRIESTNTTGRGWSRSAVPYEDREDPVEKTLAVLDELDLGGRRIGAEANAFFVTPARYEALRRGVEARGGTLIDASWAIESMRVIKSSEELVHMRRAAQAASHAMGVAREFSREGTDENAVAAEVSADLIRNGSEYAGLPPFITSGPRTTLCHSTWAGRRFSKGDVLNFELPGVVNRYCVPLYRAGSIGRPADELLRRVAVGVEALETIIATIRPGVTSNEVNAAHMAIFAKHGLGGRSQSRTGYSIGVNYPPDWGEGHIISLWGGDERPLQAGMTFHVVPGMQGATEGGDYHICTSESVLVTENGCEVLTDFPREIFVV